VSQPARDSKKKKNGMGGVIFMFVVFLMNIIGSGADEAAAIIIAIAAIAVVVGVFALIVKKAIGLNTQKSSVSFSNAKNIRQGMKMPAWNKDPKETPVFRPSKTAAVSFDENAQEKNFIRDRERRLRQLDGFLQNGIIEKEEYLILKARYMKDYR